jgi:transaldolase
MRFFLDTANLDELKAAARWGFVDGVTRILAASLRHSGHVIEAAKARRTSGPCPSK